MTLDPTSLASSLSDVFANMPTSAHDAAATLAGAYHDYATHGVFGTNVPALDDARRDALASTLEGAISNPLVGTPSTFAAAWAKGVDDYWKNVPVASPTQAGTTAGAPGASSLTGTLTAVFANLLNTAETCANSLAAALDTATKTVTATVTPPASTVIPIA